LRVVYNRFNLFFTVYMLRIKIFFNSSTVSDIFKSTILKLLNEFNTLSMKSRLLFLNSLIFWKIGRVWRFLLWGFWLFLFFFKIFCKFTIFSLLWGNTKRLLNLISDLYLKSIDYVKDSTMHSFLVIFNLFWSGWEGIAPHIALILDHVG